MTIDRAQKVCQALISSPTSVRVLGRIKIPISAHSPTIVAKFSFIHSERRDNFSSDARSNEKSQRALIHILTAGKQRARLLLKYVVYYKFLSCALPLVEMI
jgi:hypothetical protein